MQKRNCHALSYSFNEVIRLYCCPFTQRKVLCGLLRVWAAFSSNLFPVTLMTLNTEERERERGRRGRKEGLSGTDWLTDWPHTSNNWFFRSPMRRLGASTQWTTRPNRGCLHDILTLVGRGQVSREKSIGSKWQFSYYQVSWAHKSGNKTVQKTTWQCRPPELNTSSWKVSL